MYTVNTENLWYNVNYKFSILTESAAKDNKSAQNIIPVILLFNIIYLKKKFFGIS